jgi:two-component system sensor histidine kinase VanS
MARPAGLSARLKLTLSYAGLALIVVGLLLAVVWVWVFRYLPENGTVGDRGYVPGRRDLVHAFAPALIWALAVLLVAGLAGGWFLAGRMLAPLRRITEVTREVESGSLSPRIALPGRGDEFRELADSFDAMLSRLEAQVAEQRRFAANASHELRTPLAIVQTLIDTARADPDLDVGTLLDRLNTANTRAIELTEALLMLSRAEQGAFSRDDVDLSLIVEESVEALLPLAERNGITIEMTGQVAIVDGSLALLHQLTMNLLHNAIVHNTPERGLIEVATASGDGRATLTIANTGEVMDPAALATVAEPFQRGTTRVHRDQAGSGLGLAIAKAIVTAHNGSVSFQPRAGGGLVVDVHLPAGH